MVCCPTYYDTLSSWSCLGIIYHCRYIIGMRSVDFCEHRLDARSLFPVVVSFLVYVDLSELRLDVRSLFPAVVLFHVYIDLS